MSTVRLKVLGTGYNQHSEPCQFAIGLGRKMIGSVETRDGVWFAARIGPVQAKGIDPARAAEACMAKFNRS